MAKRRPNPLPLTPTAYHVLLTLTGGAMHGYAIKRLVEERTEGVVRLGAGTLYYTIKALRDRQYVEETDPPASQESTNPRLRFYAITPAGLEVLEAETKRLAADVAVATASLDALKADRP